MKKYSKKYAASLKKIDSAKVYEIAEAAKLVKETSVTKFDSTVDLAFRLNVDPTLADQLIRGTISLPHGNGKTKKVLALTMTDSGTFIVNGAERVIVSQIVRSPGAYFQDTPDKSGIHTYNGEIIPTRGTWLQFESDLKHVMWVRIDRQRKMPATILFKALGVDDEKTLISYFGDTEQMQNTLAKDSAIKTSTDALVDIFRKLKPGEPITPEGVATFLVQKFFDDKRYDLGRAGRYKYESKLGIYDRLVGRLLAENLVSADGEIFTNKAGQAFTKDYQLTKSDVQELKDAEFFEKGAHEKEIKVNKKLDTNSKVTIVKVYAHDKKGERIVSIIGTDLNQTLSRVTISDMFACFSYFCNIMNVTLYDHEGESIDMDALAKEALIEERKVNSAIRNLTSPREEQPDVTAATEVENDQVSEEGLSVTNGPAKSGDEE